MTHKLPPNLLALFAARPALRYLPPSDHAPEERKTNNVGGVAQYLSAMKDYEQIDYEPTESWLQRKDRIKMKKRERMEMAMSDGTSPRLRTLAKAFANGLKKVKDPNDDPQVRGDAFKTLFIARLSYDTTDKDLEREFGRFGPIERIRIVTDAYEGEGAKKKKKPNRGYAFIVYEREKDMKAAYKETDGIRIKDRRVLVDVERGRTVKGWKSRRLGGGLGGRGYTKGPPARPGGFAAPAGPGGFQGGFRGNFGGRGDRGGFRGGFRGGDRGGYGGGGRGGIGYQGGGGFGGRGGYGGGYGNGPAPPPNAPSGPGGGRPGFGGGGYGGPPAGAPAGGAPAVNGFAGTNGSPAGGYGAPRGSYDDRSSYRGGSSGGGGYGGDSRSGGFTGSNREPVRPREGGDRDRDRYGSRGREDDYGSRKRYHDGDGYDDSRSKRRY